MAGSIQQALDLVRKAIDQDTKGNYPDAYNAYIGSIQLFQRALVEAQETSQSPQYVQLITDKVNEYQRRALTIQQHLQADVPATNPAVTTSTAPTRSSSFTTTAHLSPQPSSASPPPYLSAPAPHVSSSPPVSPAAHQASPAHSTMRPPLSTGHQSIPTGGPDSFSTAPSFSAPRSTNLAAPALEPHLHFNWFHADRSVSASVKKWQFSWDSHREKFDVLERRNPYLRSSFLLNAAQGLNNHTIELKAHKVQRFSERTNQWEEPMSVGIELRVAFNIDTQARFISCLPEHRNTLGAEGIDRQWNAWVQSWLGVDVSREHRFVDETDVETEVEKRLTHWGREVIKLKKTVPLESSVIVYEALVEWGTLRPHTAAFTICSLGRDQQATMEKQFFVFEWPDAPSGKSPELTVAVEDWDDEFDKEVRKYMEELRENMGQPNTRSKSPVDILNSPAVDADNGNEHHEEGADDDFPSTLPSRHIAPPPQVLRSGTTTEPYPGLASPAPRSFTSSSTSPTSAASVPTASISATSQHLTKPLPGQDVDVSNTILLAELSLLRQEVAVLKDVYINEILALKSMVQSLMQAQSPASGRPAYPPGGPARP